MKTFLLIAIIAVSIVGYNCHQLNKEEWYNPLLVGNTKLNKRIKATVTGYTAIETCQNTNCTMSNGRKAEVGFVACPRWISLGTKVQILGNTYECGDRTAKKYDGRFDIFMGYTQADYERAISFGKKDLWIIIKKY